MIRTNQSTIFEPAQTLEDIKSDFITVASHQLRTPISAVRWSLDTLLSGRAGKLSTRQKEIVIAAYQNNKFMVKVVNDLLRASRLDEKGTSLMPNFENIISLTKKLIKKHLAWAKASNCTIILKSEKNLPKVFIDFSQAKLILDDLIDNAIRYSRSKGLIRIYLKKTKNFLIFRIVDDGIGIPSDQKHLVFTKFFRARNAMKAQTEGLGLDLYIAKKIIEASGGKIVFKSRENRGSIFTLYLPLTKSQFENQVEGERESVEDILKKEREFVTITVHELKAPLGVSKWSLEMLKSQKPGRLNKNQLELIDQIYHGNERLLVLVRDLLNLAKLQEGQFEVNIKPLNLDPVLAEVVSSFNSSIKVKKINLTIFKQIKPLPLVLADESRIAQVLTNLLSNAIKYTPAGGKIDIQVSQKSGNELKPIFQKLNYGKIYHTKNNKGYLVFCVADTGVGISVQDQQKLFTRFFRSKKILASQVEGTGLGLYISKSIINLHQGDIWFTSEFGQGSNFYFSFPLV